MLKQRNSNYHHICRLLIESVIASDSVSTRNILAAAPSGTSRFYHCIDAVHFRRFDVDIHGPLSVTTQIEIAIHCVSNREMIGGDGMILELDGAASIKWLDVGVLGGFGHENEQLLFAAPDRVQVVSIRKINDSDRWVKYRAYLLAINLYDDLLRHKGSPKRQRGDEIIAQHIEGILKEAVSTSFIGRHFGEFCRNQSEIVLDIGYMTKYYPAVSRIFVAESGEWLQYDRIARVHAECTEVTTSSFQVIEVGSGYLEAVLSMVEELEASKLQRIYVLNPSVQCGDEELTSFGDQFKDQGWKLGLNDWKLSISKLMKL